MTNFKILSGTVHCAVFAAAAAAAFMLPAPAQAGTADANAFPPANPTPPFGPLTVPVGTFYLNEGFDFTFGNTEGVFDDLSAFGFCGINLLGNCDLVTTVDAQIFHPGTSIPGLTDFLTAEAGNAADGTLTLTAFDLNQNVIATALNGPPAGPNGRSTFTINTGGVFDIAYFSISGNDTFGVNSV